MAVRVPPVALVRQFERVNASLGLAQLRPGRTTGTSVEIAAMVHQALERAGEVSLALVQVFAVLHGQGDQVGAQIGALLLDDLPAGQIGA